MTRITLFVVLHALATAGAEAQAPARPADTAELVRRLEQAEARITALEDIVRRQAEEAANERRRTDEIVMRTGQLEAEEAQEALAAPSPPEPSAVETPPERPVTHRAVSLAFSGLVQAWYAAGNAGMRDTFRVRRSEIYFSGAISRKARWQVMLDPAKVLGLDTALDSIDGRRVLGSAAVSQASRLLQNAVVTFDQDPHLQVSIGQFKLPLSREGQVSSGRLDTVERALFLSDRARGGAYGDVRDIGLLVRGGVGGPFEYQVGVFNGVAESQNDLDRNDQKALAGTVVLRPQKTLRFGFSGAWGHAATEHPRRDRLGADFHFRRGPFLLRAELMTGHDGPLSRRGYYAHAGYRFLPKLEAVARLDNWDPDTRAETTPQSVTERDYVAGLNLLLNEHSLKVQANYIRKTFRTDVLPSRNVFLINTQTFW